MVKLVICDLDGTLVGRDEVLSPASMRVPELCRESGVGFTIATGRTEDLANAYAAALGITLPVIVSNGAKIIQGDQVLWSRTIPLSGLRPLIDLAHELEMSVIYTIDGVEYITRVTPWIERQRATFDRYHRLRPIPDSDWDSLIIDKITLMDGIRDGRIDRIEQEATHLSPLYSTTKYTNKAIEIVHGEATKATALRWLVGHLGIDMADTLAFGDHQNDVPMLQEAGLGVAVANAIDITKSHADIVSTLPEAEGVLEVLHHALSQQAKASREGQCVE